MEAKKLCVACGNEEMTFDTRDLEFSHHGRSTLVTRVPGWFCPHCGEAYLEDQGRYAQAVADFARKVDAEETAYVRTVRKKLGLRQSDAGKLFGGGASAFSDYERGKTQPHKSTVLLLRLLDKHPELLKELT
ncbi:MAG TPA: type II TA system antitoxin MqsA family protein [Rhodocyclaceae bacterium]|nr:type II TA system antitoxin MqsA family protein [Rhodocyclaceae bacterium]